ncbi:MAG: T9SS type A sorting domain-containing protein, partial [bacterium]|nr:T9SS type A sorting domain-containing protein [bacterium]
SDVTISIFDVLGRHVTTIIEHQLDEGEADIRWDGRDARGRKVPSGVYFYRLEAAGLTSTRKLVLMR